MKPHHEHAPSIDATMTTTLERSAVFSHDRLYRYELWRRWGQGPYCQFVCLNPSTADEGTDGPTVRRCIHFAQDWGTARLS
jgi:hypothetical protein